MTSNPGPTSKGNEALARQRAKEARYGGSGYASFAKSTHRVSRRAACPGCTLTMRAFKSVTEFRDHVAVCEGSK